MKIKPMKAADLPALKQILSRIPLFPPEILADMSDPFLSGETPEEIWLTCHEEEKPIGFCYARTEPLTEGTWNMLALGIDPAHHRRGAARLLVSGLEADLAARSARLLIVDTSGTKAFDGARGFYEASGYEKESRIRDYWAEGDDKITFRKSLRKNA